MKFQGFSAMRLMILDAIPAIHGLDSGDVCISA